MLELPPTIRVPRADELPDSPDITAAMQKRSQAIIEEGFVLQPNTDHALPFQFYAEVNINNSRCWHLFHALAGLLPEEVCCVYNQYDADTSFSPYLNRHDLFQLLQAFKLELTQDGNLELGLLYHTEEILQEVLITDAKYLKVWGMEEQPFRDVMTTFGLQEITGLHFVDEFPKVVEPISKHHPDAAETEEVIETLNSFFH